MALTDLDDVLTGVMLAIDHTRDWLSLWEKEEGGELQIIHQSHSLAHNEDYMQCRTTLTQELVDILDKTGRLSFKQPHELVEKGFGEVFIDAVDAIGGSPYYLVKFARVPFPFELKHSARNKKVSELEKAIVRNLVHEVLTPLNSVEGLGEQLAEIASCDKGLEVLGLHGEACQRLKSRITDIINAISLRVSETRCYSPSVFDLFETVFSISSKSNRSIYQNSRSLVFKMNCPSEYSALPILGFPDLLEQALLHLIDNAIKFTPDGGRIDVNVQLLRNNSLRFSIIDTGCGIKEEDAKLFFKPFIMGDMADTREHKGMGLGLSSAVDCLLIMCGNSHACIHYAANPKGGSIFSFEIPYEQAVLESSETDLLDLPKSVDQYNILIAEDTPTQQMIIKRLVTKLGFVCQLVENGVEAVGEYVRGDTHYDLILMDIQMPGISGHEATELIRKHEEEFNWARVPIVAITANIEKEVHSQSLRVGMDGHFGKPVTRLVLDELIRKALLGITI
jgi:signal transduction histidine kinase/ActR/RegA family two-component response regulator